MFSRRANFFLFIFLAVVLVLPEFFDKFYIQLVTKGMIMAIFAMSLDLLIGYTGLVSLGHAAFFGLAGYLLAFAAPEFQPANLWTSLFLTMMFCAIFASVIGFITLRTSGIYFIMVTLAISQMLYFFIHDSKVAGGSDGVYIYMRPDATFFGWKPFDLENISDFYYFTLTLLVLTYCFLRALVRSVFGRVLSGIRLNESRMNSLGYPTFRYKVICFVFSGTLAGVAGYLSAAQFGVVNPDMLGWHMSGNVLVMVILGGMGTLLGPAMGAFILLLLELIFQTLPSIGGVNLSKHWHLFMGGAIVLVALFLPAGVAGLIRGKSQTRQPIDD